MSSDLNEGDDVYIKASHPQKHFKGKSGVILEASQNKDFFRVWLHVPKVGEMVVWFPQGDLTRDRSDQAVSKRRRAKVRKELTVIPGGRTD